MDCKTAFCCCYIIIVLEILCQLWQVTGLVEITLKPSQVVQDVTSTQSLSFSCSVRAANEIQDITSLRLQRNGQSIACIFAVKNVSAYIEHNFEQEANSRGFVLDWKYIPTTPPAASITLTLNRSKVMCSDQLQYGCHLDYFSLSYIPQSEEQYANLSVYVPPSMVQNALKVYKNGTLISGCKTRETASTSFNVGDAVTLECGTSIGSDSTVKIFWKITSEVSDDTFLDHLPAGNFSDEVTKAGQCEFTRKAKTLYNITSFDANRNYKTMLGFVCYAVVFHAAIRYETPMSEKFYINLVLSNADIQTVHTDNSVVGPIVGGSVGAIAFITAIVLVYMLVLRRYECICRKKAENSDSHTEYQTSSSTYDKLDQNITMASQTYEELTHNKTEDSKTNESLQTYEKLNHVNTVDSQTYQGLKHDNTEDTVDRQAYKKQDIQPNK